MMKLLKPDSQRELSDAAESEFRKAAENESTDAENTMNPGETSVLSKSGDHGETIENNRKARLESFETRLLNIAVAAGFPPHVAASRFFIDAIKVVVTRPSRIQNPKKSLYPAVARRNFTSTWRVKRALERTAKTSVEKGKTVSFGNALGVEIFRADDRPTAIEMIAVAADVLTKEFGEFRF